MNGSPLDAEFLKRNCREQWSDIVAFDRIDSTSNWVKQQTQGNLVCLAEQQTAGRGRHGHQWQSPNAENVYLSYSWQFDKTPDHLGLLSLWVGVVLAEVIEQLGLQGHGVKWPNDLYWQQKKMGGILIEASNLSPKLVIGIGLNVSMTEGRGIDQPWTSVSEAVQQPVNRNTILVNLLDSLHQAMVEFPYVDQAEFMRRWNKWDLIRGHQVSFIDGNSKLTGESQGIDHSGHLKVMLETGECRSFGTSISQVRWQ